MRTANRFPDELIESINNIAGKEGYLSYQIHIELNSGDGGNFLGELYEVDIKGQTNDGHKEVNLFVKVNRGLDNLKWVTTENLYPTELFAYKELSVIFAELEDEANVPAHERFRMVKSYPESTTKAIILENIKKKGFVALDRTVVVPLKYAEMAIKQLAKLHALSFVVEEKRPEFFNARIKDLTFGIGGSPDWKIFMKNMLKATIQYVDIGVRHRVENTFYKLAEQYEEFYEDDTCTRCLTHGDYKNVNIMAKIIDGEVIDIMPLDYQLAYYGCPVLDFLQFIFMSTNKQFRDTHLSYLKDLYHGTLGTFLGYFNMDVERVYPRKMFDDVYKKKLPYGLLVSYMTLPLLIVPNDHLPVVTDEFSKMKVHISEEYKNRQRGFIEEFIELLSDFI